MYFKYATILTKTSKNYIAFTLFQILLSSILFVYILLDPQENLQQWWVGLLELILTLIIFIDILIRMIAEGKNRFLEDNWNILDMISFCLIVLLLMIYYNLEMTRVDNSEINIEEADDLLSLIIIIARYGIQFARLFALVKKSHELTRIVEDIKFEGQEEKQVESQQMNFDKYVEQMRQVQIEMKQYC